jgi:uncharacterized membrane protein
MAGRRLSESMMRQALLLLGITQLAIGAWLVIDPDSFVDVIAPFGPADSHFLRDLGTFQAGIGIALLVTAGRPTWRAPILFAALAQSALHTINHLFDIGNTDPGWLGPANFVAVLLLTATYAFLMREAALDARPRAARAPRASERLPA